jgi:hypothetical protein
MEPLTLATMTVRLLAPYLAKIGDQAIGAASEGGTLRQQHLIGLRQILETRFNEGELRTLSFDLGVAYDDLPAGGAADKARELISYLERRNRISDLVESGKKQRPDIPWETALKSIREAPSDLQSIRPGRSRAKKTVEPDGDRMRDLYTVVKHKLTGDAYAEQTLGRLAKNPDSESRRAALVGVVEEKIEDDPAFAEALQRLLAEAREAAMETITQQVTVSDQAQTGDITQVGKIEGNVDLSKRFLGQRKADGRED